MNNIDSTEIWPRIPGFGARLRTVRRSRNLKQAYVAHLAGVDQATVSRWERGIVKPEPKIASTLLRNLSRVNLSDFTIRKLIDSSSLTLHLISDIDHRLLAASPAREAEWGRSTSGLIGQSVWPAASPAIESAEYDLESLGWWDCQHPAPVTIKLESFDNGFLPIIAGDMRWERLWLTDGEPARLCTLI